MKTCNKCGETKTLDSFYKRRAECKVCKNEASRKYREANKEKIVAYQKDYREANRGSWAGYQKAYREANPLRIREKELRYRTLEGMPETLIKTKALHNYIKHQMKEEIL